MKNFTVHFDFRYEEETWIARNYAYTNEQTGHPEFNIEVNEYKFKELPVHMQFAVLQHELGHVYAAHIEDQTP